MQRPPLYVISDLRVEPRLLILIILIIHYLTLLMLILRDLPILPYLLHLLLEELLEPYIISCVISRLPICLLLSVSNSRYFLHSFCLLIHQTRKQTVSGWPTDVV